jgi:thiol:disulfide interchange protein DsbA
MRGWKWMAAALTLAAGQALAQQSFVEGRDYQTLSPALPQTGSKIEVVEFFWYGCPHCYRLQKPWEPWLAANGSKVAYKAQPAVMGKSWEPMAKAHHAMLMAGGFDPALHQKFFSAIHEKKMKIQELDKGEPKALYAMVAAEKGAPYAAKFKSAYESFGMGQQIAKDRDLQKTYKLEGTPTIVVAGKYSVNPGMSRGEEGMVPVVDFLVKKATAEARKK